jgi:hypothetical protein
VPGDDTRTLATSKASGEEDCANTGRLRSAVTATTADVNALVVNLNLGTLPTSTPLLRRRV